MHGTYTNLSSTCKHTQELAKWGQAVHKVVSRVQTAPNNPNCTVWRDTLAVGLFAKNSLDSSGFTEAWLAVDLVARRRRCVFLGTNRGSFWARSRSDGGAATDPLAPPCRRTYDRSSWKKVRTTVRLVPPPSSPSAVGRFFVFRHGRASSFRRIEVGFH
jgi:hypothetical protein